MASRLSAQARYGSPVAHQPAQSAQLARPSTAMANALSLSFQVAKKSSRLFEVTKTLGNGTQGSRSGSGGGSGVSGGQAGPQHGGPTSREELFQWASQYMQVMFGPAAGTGTKSLEQKQRLETFIANMTVGVSMWSRYSGMEQPIHAAREIQNAFATYLDGQNLDVHSEFRGFSLQSACDNNPKALQALKCLTTHEGWPAAFAPQHMFGDLLDSVLHVMFEQL